MHTHSKIYVAGHRGLVGASIVHRLKQLGYENIITRTRQEVDLFDLRAVATFFEKEKPEYVFLAAAKVGGILANVSNPAQFIYENLSIQNNVIHEAYVHKVKKLLFLGSSCIYPKLCPQPIKEEYLLTGPLEETNKSYSLAKISGLVMCQSYNKEYGTNFISTMPTNLYGPFDNFSPKSSHVIPSLIRKFDEAKTHNIPEVVCWGSGMAFREFLFIEDHADASVFLMNHYNDSEIINVGTGEDISIKDLAEKIKDIVGYQGTIVWDTTKPDGTPRKLLDVSKLRTLGWRHTTDLDVGLKKTYTWYLHHKHKLPER